jgi:hypothetical protein
MKNSIFDTVDGTIGAMEDEEILSRERNSTTLSGRRPFRA